MRWAEKVSREGEMGSFYRILVGAPEGKRPFRRPIGANGRII